MNTSSERHRVQTFLEDSIGCPSPEKLPEYKARFESFAVTHVAKREIDERMAIDAKAYLKKGFSSLVQGLQGLDNGHETWSLIKMYYAMYFFQRSRLATDGIAFLRCRNIYTLESKIGESPKKRTGKAYQGDHKATISLYSNHFAQRDIYLSQPIDGINPFSWFSQKRDWVNYKKRDFIDKVGMPGLNTEIDAYSSQVERSCEDHRPILCFDPDFALLALPVSFGLSVIRSSLDAIERANLVLHTAEQIGTTGSAKVLVDALMDS